MDDPFITDEFCDISAFEDGAPAPGGAPAAYPPYQPPPDDAALAGIMDDFCDIGAFEDGDLPPLPGHQGPAAAAPVPKQAPKRSAIIMSGITPTISSANRDSAAAPARAVTDIFRRIVVSEASVESPGSPDASHVRFEAEGRLREQQQYIQQFNQMPLPEQLQAVQQALDDGSIASLEAFREIYGRSDKVHIVQTDPRFSHQGVLHSVVGRISRSRRTELALVLELVTILARTDNNQKLLAQGGVIQDKLVLHCACRALANLAVRGENKGLIVQVGGMSMAVAAMRTFNSENRLLYEGARALRNLALAGPSGSNGKKMMEEGVITLILEVMQKHRTDALLQHMCCGVLCNLAVDDSNKLVIARDGGVTAVLGSIRAHPKDGRVLHEAARTLGNLAVHAENKAWLAQTVVPDVVAAMAALPSDIKLQDQCCRVLCYLSSLPENIDLISSAGALMLVLRNLHSHPSESRLQSHALWLLCNLATIESNNHICAKQNTVNMVLRVLATHCNEERRSDELQARILQEGCRTLSSLSLIEENRVAFVQNNGYELIVKCMMDFHDNALLQLEACVALASMLSISAPDVRAVAKKSFSDCGGLEAARVAKQKHGDDKDVKRAAAELTKKAKA